MKERLSILFVLLVLLSACTSTAPTSGEGGGMEIYNATVVLPGSGSMPGMDMGSELSGYMKIKNASGSDDRLVGITSDFAGAMLHETTINGDVATMNDLTSIDVPSGATIEFKHGGLHIMFMNLKKDLKVGDTVNLTLEFEKAGNVIALAKVTDQ